MTALASTYPSTAKRIRRTATNVVSGEFDPHPARDVLTSLLNGVPPYKVVEKDEESRRTRKREKRERERERKKQKSVAQKKERTQVEGKSSSVPAAMGTSTSHIAVEKPATTSVSSFWRVRPSIRITTTQRSVSVTPPPVSSPHPLPSTPVSTPGESISSSISRTSSKRPHTPDDYDPFNRHQATATASPAGQPPRKKRTAVKKGWKGWVEGSPPPSEKLINLDAVPILQERRTRSGKSFDAIGVGKEGWV